MVIISTAISAIATCVIAYATWQNYKMYKIIQNRDQEYKEQTKDLYQAIVIATLLSGPSSYGAFKECKNMFKEEYAGNAPIFKR